MAAAIVYREVMLARARAGAVEMGGVVGFEIFGGGADTRERRETGVSQVFGLGPWKKEAVIYCDGEV